MSEIAFAPSKSRIIVKDFTNVTSIRKSHRGAAFTSISGS
ncbi:hypothetical protein NHJ13051_006078 [Beauveria bassiana]